MTQDRRIEAACEAARELTDRLGEACTPATAEELVKLLVDECLTGQPVTRAALERVVQTTAEREAAARGRIEEHVAQQRRIDRCGRRA